MVTMAATVHAFTAERREDLDAIWRQSVRDLVTRVKLPVGAGGHMPIDTSFLQNSFVGSAQSMPSINPEHDSDMPPMTGNAAIVEALINSAQLGDTLYFGFTAAYALRLEYGFVGWDSLGRYYDQAGYHFVGHAVADWQQIVSANERRLSAAAAFSET